MKPPLFEYDDPKDLNGAFVLLAEHGDDAKVLAGGQSLVPLLNFRLARPDRLIDINGVSELAYLREEDGLLRIGAMTRQTTLERSELVAQKWPLLTEAIRWAGHSQIRNRGTVGGSCVHADPAAELPVAFTALDARFHVRSANGARTLGGDELFVWALSTSLEPEELLVEIEVPVVPPKTGWAFVEFARRHGDFALGGAAVLITVDAGGVCERAAVALLGAAPKPIRLTQAERSLTGRPIDEEAADEAAACTAAEISPTGDIHGSAEYRRDLISVLVRRAVLKAAERAKEGSA